jgi:hypothetical protein
MKTACENHTVHGFYPGRNAVTNAMTHIGHRYTVTADLRNFFDTVKKEQVAFFLPPEVVEKVFVDGSPGQGLPTSPAVANIAASWLDHDIKWWAKQNGLKIIYTRYADDLTISCDDEATRDAVLAALPDIVTRAGFELAGEKTKVYDAKAGRRMITGVAVGERDVYPSRRIKRKLRAALHQGNTSSAAGLSEWAKCKLPNAWIKELQDALQDMAGRAPAKPRRTL